MIEVTFKEVGQGRVLAKVRTPTLPAVGETVRLPKEEAPRTVLRRDWEFTPATRLFESRTDVTVWLTLVGT